MSEQVPTPPQPSVDEDDDESLRQRAKEDARLILRGAKAVGSGVAQGAGAVVNGAGAVVEGVAAAAPKLQAGAEAVWDGAKKSAQFVRENAGVVGDGVAAGAEAIKNGANFVVGKLPGGDYVKQGLQVGYDAAADTFGPVLEQIREVVSVQLEVLKQQLAEMMEPDPNFDFNEMIDDIMRPIMDGTAKSLSAVWRSLNRLSMYLSAMVQTLAADLVEEMFPGLQDTMDKMHQGVRDVVNPTRKRLQGGVETVSSGVRSVTNSMSSGVGSVTGGVQEGYSTATSAVGSSVEGVRDRVRQELERLRSVLGGVVEAGTNISVFEKIKGMFQPILDGTVRRAQDIRKILEDVRLYFAATVNRMLGRESQNRLHDAEKSLATIHDDIESQVENGKNEEAEEEDAEEEDAEEEEVQVAEEQREVVKLEEMGGSDEMLEGKMGMKVVGEPEAVQVMRVAVPVRKTNGASVESFLSSGSAKLSVKERVKLLEKNREIAKVELAKPRPLPNRAKGRNLAVSDEATAIFNKLCLEPFSVQGEAFLNAYWEECGSQAPFIFEVAYELMKEVDMVSGCDRYGSPPIARSGEIRR